MPRYTCPECALVVELKTKQAEEAMKCFRCDQSFEPHLHPAAKLLDPATLHGQGKENLSTVDSLGTLMLTAWFVLPVLLFLGFLFLFFIFIPLFSL